jgi:hypothetical protein
MMSVERRRCRRLDDDGKFFKFLWEMGGQLAWVINHWSVTRMWESKTKGQLLLIMAVLPNFGSAAFQQNIAR